MKRITKSLAATAIITLALAACGTTTTAKDHVTGEDLNVNVSEVTITLSDTRRVYCIILDRAMTGQAMSCDWSHVDGSDNLKGKDY